jgi:hypothetical protein
MKLKIEQDTDPVDPREWDNLGTMVCFHRGYNLGDKHDYHTEDHGSWEELRKQIEEDNEVAAILPLYLYDHSGITMNTEGFHCGWDSGQVGWIFVSKDTLKAEQLADLTLSSAEEYLKGEVATYDQFLTGDVWGCVVEDDDGNHLDSCWGFFGHSYAEEEGAMMLAYCQKQADEEAVTAYVEDVGGADSPYNPEVVARCKS